MEVGLDDWSKADTGLSAPRRLLLASYNRGKARELRQLIAGASFVLTTPSELGISVRVEETGATYEENASLKARAFAASSGLVALADDSGLEVDALGGAPGLFSARYAGPEASDSENLDLLLSKLAGAPRGKRAARFVCVVAIATPSGAVELCRGACEGIIALEPAGCSGFGYDPVFYLPNLGKTMAQLDMAEKNRISHRARAVGLALPIAEKLIREYEARGERA